jgi:hypothetical protein
LAAASTPWEKYVQNPTPENAALVQDASYSHPTDYEHGLASDLPMLASQVHAGDKQAFFLALRLRKSIYSEALSWMIGEYLRIRPREFLEGLKQFGVQRHCRDALSMDVRAFADRPKAVRYELNARIAALQSVEDPEFADIRDACILELQRQVPRFE